ncbi:hypothetical protein Cpir12675_005874 [Ceratocystis pirilliformis]|uniref:Uncharacterized protein n=1 Tax=Ceratocystis pirilliformis TaxID=259994 RepID=A0ABR3YMY7_9PEZI
MAVADDHQSDRLSSPDPLNSESDYPQSTTPARRAFRSNRKNTTTADSARNLARSQSPTSQSTAVRTRLSTYRVTPRTRTIAQRSVRDSATAPSPRKQTFELEVGHDISPQRLLVTVEAGDFDFSASGLHRRLFASSTPPSQASPSRMATPLARSTRRVPLKGEDEVSTRIAGTPRRPRASSNSSRRETPGATPTDTPRRTQTAHHRSVTPGHQASATPMRRSTRKTKSLMSNTVMISDLASTTPNSAFDLGETPIPAVPKEISKPKPTTARRSTRTRNTPEKEPSVPDIHDGFDLDDVLLFPVLATKSRPDVPSHPTPADSGASATSGEPTTTVNVVTTTIPIADTPQISRREFKRSRSNGEDYFDTPATKRRFTPRRPTPARLGPTNSSSNGVPATESFADLFLDSTPDRSVSPSAHRNESLGLFKMPTVPETSSVQKNGQAAAGAAPDNDGDLWLDNLSDDETRFRSASRDAETANRPLQPTSIVPSVETEHQTELYTNDHSAYGTRGVSEAKAYEELATPNTEPLRDEQEQEDTDQSQQNHDEHSTQQKEDSRNSHEPETHLEYIQDGPKSLLNYRNSPFISPSQAHHNHNPAELSLVPGSSRLAPLRIESEAPSEPMSEAMSASSHMRHDEDFSMIFPDSLHIDTSLPLGSRNDFGDTTNLAINRTLESLRRDRENGENSQLNSSLATPVHLETVAEEPEEENRVQDLPRLSSPLIRFGNSPLLRSATKNAAAAHNSTSPMLGRALTPRQRKPPSLSQQLLTREALKAEQTPAGKIVDKAKSLGTLLSSGARRKPRQSLQSQQPEYEDSFTQPSGSFLAAMAPKTGDYDHLSQEESTTPDTVQRHDVIDLGSDGETPRKPLESSKVSSTPAENNQTKSLGAVVTPETRRSDEIQTTGVDTRKPYGAPPRISISTVPTMDKNIGAIAAPSSPAPSTVQPIERPLLSSAVRAGWALQTVTSEKSSPMNQNGLGSPFRGGDSSPLANRKSSNNHTLEVPAPNPPPLFGGPTRSSVPPDSLPSIPEPTSPVTYEQEDSIFKTVPATQPTTSFRRPGRVHHAASLSPLGESTAATAPVVPVLAAEEEHIADVSWTTDPSRSVLQNTAPPRPDSQALRKENMLLVKAASNSERKGDEDDDDDLWAIEADRLLAGNSTGTHTPTAQKGVNKRTLPDVENKEVEFLQLPPNKKSKKNDEIQPKADSILPQPRLASINKATTVTAPRQNGARMHMQGLDASKYRGSSRFRPMIGRHRGIVSQNGSGESPEVSSKTAFFQRKLEQAHREAAAKAGQKQKQSLQMGTSSPATPAILSKDGNEQRSVFDPGPGAGSGPGSGRIDLSTFFSSPLSLPFQSARKAATAVAAAASRRFYPGTTATIDMQDEADSNNVMYGDSRESNSSVLPTSSMFPSLPPRQPGTRTRNIHRYQPQSQSQSQPPSRVVEVSRSSSPIAAEADDEPEDTFFNHSMAHTIDQSHLNDYEEEEDHEATDDEVESDHSVVDIADAQLAKGDDDNGNIHSDAAIASIASMDEDDNAEDQNSSQSDPQEPQDEPMTPSRRLAVTTPQNAHTPPQMQLSCNDISRWREETSKVMEESPKEMRPLPRPGFPHHRALSPPKSCMRSPLKGRTPGRVVEFTSSTLSPLEQQRQRLQRQRSLAVDEQNRLEEEQREAEALANFERQVLEGARREREVSVVSGMSEPSPKLRHRVGIVPPVTLAPPASGFVHQPIEMDVGEDTDPDYEYEDDNDDDEDEDVESEEEEARENQPQPDDREVMDTPGVEQGKHAHRTSRLADLFTPKQTLAERQRAATASYHYLEPQAPPSDLSSSPSAASNASSAPTIVLPRRMHLSRRTWTNSHWRHLKYLVRIRRTRLFYFNARYVRPSEQARLVGETVSGAGESMRIMQEHADAIDAFMGDVPGWDVRDVAKRVFALVKADELRQREWLNQQNHRYHDNQSQNQHQNGEGSSWWRNWVPFL